MTGNQVRVIFVTSREQDRAFGLLRCEFLKCVRVAWTGSERREGLHLFKGLVGNEPPGQRDGFFSGVSLSSSCHRGSCEQC